jgi:hypothetical protein
MRFDVKGIFRRVVPVLASFSFSLVLTAGNAPAQPPEEPEEQTLLASARPPLKVLMDTDESFWALQPNSSEVIRYSRSGRIIGGCNVAAARGLLPGARITAHDFTLRPDGTVHILVGAVNLKTDEIASYVARCTGERVELLRLSAPIAAFRVGFDREGVIHILGLREPDFRAVDVGRQKKGTYPVVHRFSPEGALLGSYLPMELDPTTPETHTNTIGNPFHAQGNFVVEPDGTAWVAWYHFPPPAEGGCLPFEIYRVSPDGELASGLPVAPPAAQECCFHGLLTTEQASGVAMVWTCLGGAETVLVDSGSRELYRGQLAGGVLALREGCLVVGARVGPGRQYSVRLVRPR